MRGLIMGRHLAALRWSQAVTTAVSRSAQKDLLAAQAAHFSAVVEVMFSAQSLRGRFKGLDGSWVGPVVKPPPGRKIPGGEEYQRFVEEYGIPESWARVFEDIRWNEGMTFSELSQRRKIPEMEALDILLGLACLNMLKPSWSSGGLTFTLIESSWVALLNGRPA